MDPFQIHLVPQVLPLVKFDEHSKKKKKKEKIRERGSLKKNK